MQRSSPWMLVALTSGILLATGCPPSGTNGTHNDSGTQVSSVCDSGYCVSVLAPGGNELQPMAMAVRSDDTVGVAFFSKAGNYIQDDAGLGGVYKVRYLEWQNGTLYGPFDVPTFMDGGTTPDVNPMMKRIEGIALAYQPNGSPAVSFMGGEDDSQAYWFQHESWLDTRNPDGTWKATVVEANDGPSIIDVDPISANPMAFLVGMWPALGYTSDGQAWLAFRDGHYGAFPVQDWGAADVQVARQNGSAWTVTEINNYAQYGKAARGCHNQMVLVNGLPSIVFDELMQPGDGVNDGPHDVFLQQLHSDGGWSGPYQLMTVGNTQLGPSFTYDSELGYAVAVFDASSGVNTLLYSTSALDGGTVWNTPEPVWGLGSGGWYPSLAIDPQAHVPWIAYHFCDTRAGIGLGQCSSVDMQLRVAYRRAADATWHNAIVDRQGGWSPKLGFLSTGKKVVVYRQPQGPNVGQLKIAVEQ